MTKTLTVAMATVLLVGACGSGQKDQKEQEEPSSDWISQIVSAACSDLNSATSQAQASRTLLKAMDLAESVGVSNTQLGSLLSAECRSAVQRGNDLP
jgi:ABC-type phosphate/phosphonate transport system substrate-binding protein